MQAERLTDDALEPISSDRCATQLYRNCQPQAWMTQPVRTAHDGEVSIGGTTSVFENAVEILCACKLQTLAKTVASSVIRLRSECLPAADITATGAPCLWHVGA